MDGHVDYFRDESGRWYFRIVASNGEELARSTDGYERFAGAANGFGVLQRVLGGAFEVRVEGEAE